MTRKPWHTTSDLSRELERGRAHAAVRKAILVGILTRPTECELASDECCGPIQAAHYDYSPFNWLRVRWLCRTHHMQWDSYRRTQESIWSWLQPPY